ncbi:hypothetical protein AAG570_009240 [Ranatra chinensis]|uniref:Phosphatidylinositol N-acetylglucosaminyltransferase subunit H conserved domain-containing protein n=1 Tax=Ranatra chinensis TaxID=642074 RepID=A0ABD0YTB1_9HEMI
MWVCRKTNTTGRILYQYSLNDDYVILAPRTLTHLSNGGLSDILDIVIIKGINLNATLDAVNDLSSDNLPVIMNLESDGLLAFDLLWAVKSETLLMTVPVGLQLTTTYVLGQESILFIPWDCLEDIIIIEVITGQQVLYYLAATLSGERSHVILNNDGLKSHLVEFFADQDQSYGHRIIKLPEARQKIIEQNGRF